MDALALLCNLHGDGPLTLQRLRRLGCETLECLQDLEVDALAAQLQVDVDAAERFRREASLLAQRLQVDAWGGEEEWESEEVWDEEEADEPVAQDSSAPASSAPGPPAPAQVSSVPDRPASAPRTEIGKVLTTWRSLDQSEPPLPPQDYEVPRPPDPLGNRALDETALDGLTPDLVAQLAEIGVLSLRGLFEADTLTVARELEYPFTHVRRLQFLARRAWQRILAEQAPPRGTPPMPAPLFDPQRDPEHDLAPEPERDPRPETPSERTSPVAPPRERGGEHLDSAGPFA